MACGALSPVLEFKIVSASTSYIVYLNIFQCSIELIELPCCVTRIVWFFVVLVVLLSISLKAAWWGSLWEGSTVCDRTPTFSRMRSKGFPFIVGGLGVGPLFASSWSARRFRVVFRVVNSVSIGEAAKPRVFCYVDVAVSIGEAAKPRVFCYVDVAVSIREAAELRVFCYVDVAVSIGEAAKTRVFCYVDVAVSLGEAAKPRVFCCVDVAVMSPCL